MKITFNTFRTVFLSLGAMAIVFYLSAFSAGDSPPKDASPPQSEVVSPDTLVIVWTSADPEVAENMVFMYAYNAKKYGWWDEVVLITWGPSAKLLSENSVLQQKLSQMNDEAVILRACKACADQYGVAVKLEELGVEVIYIGKELTDYIKSDSKVLTF